MALRTFSENLSGLFLKQQCPGCGCSLSRDDGYLCSWCSVRLYPATHISSHGVGIRVFSIFLHQGIPRDLVIRLKYQGERYLASYAARLIMDHIHHVPDEGDVIVPIPASRRKARERGFNQAELIGRHLARLSGSDFRKLLSKEDRPAQVGLSEEERRKNVEGAFSVIGDVGCNGRIWLVDDVMTTGSTMDAASYALIAVGATRVSGITLTYRNDFSMYMI